jgi:putative oxidoreductase
MDVVFLIGRILFALLFISSALMVHLFGEGRRQAIEYARASGAPAPDLLVPLSGLAILAGGLMVAFGIWADLGALLIIGFLASITPIMHAYWKIDDPQMRAIQNAMFFKNVALLGAAIVIFWLFNQLVDPPLTITDALFNRID